MSSIIRDIEIARAAGFVEHPTEPKPIAYTHNKTTYSNRVLTPYISWESYDSGVRQPDILAAPIQDVGFAFLVPSSSDLTAASFPYTAFADAMGYSIPGMTYYRYPKETYPSPIQVSVTTDTARGVDIYSWTDPYAPSPIPSQEVPEHSVALLQTPGVLNRDSNGVWYCSAGYSWYAKNSSNVWYRVNTRSYMDNMIISTGGSDAYIRYITAINELTARTLET